MSFTPYVHFQGNCAEAIAYYADVFGAKPDVFRYRDMPDGPPEFKDCDLVMNATLTASDGLLMASDYPPGHKGDPQAAFSISHFAPDVTKAQAIFDRLAEGGSVIMDFMPTFWSPGFGMLKDRFGTHWMVSVPGPA